jgi:hypothetical protein
VVAPLEATGRRRLRTFRNDKPRKLEPDDKKYYGPEIPNPHANPYGASNWVNPYGEGMRVVYPTLPRAARVALMLRVRGRVLSFMRKWPEAAPHAGVIKSEPKVKVDKAVHMAEHKAVEAHRTALDKTIERLASKRDPLRAQLEAIEVELKMLLASRRALGSDDDDEAPIDPTVRDKAPKGKRGKKVKGKPGRKRKGKPNGDDVAATALDLLGKGNVTAESLAAVTGQTRKNAAQTLARLGRNGEAKRVSRGVYGSAA